MPVPDVIFTKEETGWYLHPPRKKAVPFHALPALIWRAILHQVTSPGTKFKQV